MTLRLMRAMARFLLRLLCRVRTPSAPKMRRSTLGEMVSAGYYEFYCTKDTYFRLLNTYPPKQAVSSTLQGAVGGFSGITFHFNAHVQDGVFIPKALGYMMWVEVPSE